MVGNTEIYKEGMKFLQMRFDEASNVEGNAVLRISIGILKSLNLPSETLPTIGIYLVGVLDLGLRLEYVLAPTKPFLEKMNGNAILLSPELL